MYLHCRHFILWTFADIYTNFFASTTGIIYINERLTQIVTRVLHHLGYDVTGYANIFSENWQRLV